MYCYRRGGGLYWVQFAFGTAPSVRRDPSRFEQSLTAKEKAMSEIEPKVKTEPEVKAETPKEEPGEKELSEQELDKVSGGFLGGLIKKV